MDLGLPPHKLKKNGKYCTNFNDKVTCLTYFQDGAICRHESGGGLAETGGLAVPHPHRSFFGFFNKATVYTPGRIFTQNTSNDVVPGKEVPFGGLDDYIL